MIAERFATVRSKAQCVPEDIELLVCHVVIKDCGLLVFYGHVGSSLICSLAEWREAMTAEVDSKGRPIDQKCKHCGNLFTATRLRKHLDSCKGPEGMRVCDLSGAARARRVRLLFSPKKKKKTGRSIFAVNGGAFGLGKSRKH